MKNEAIRALLVDDSVAFLASAVELLSQERGIEVVGWTLSAGEALDIVRHLEVDVVLMDVAMPGISGLEAARRMKARSAAPKVVMLTLHDGPEYREAARAAGADAFVAKTEMGRLLLPVLEALFAEGEAN
jgi:DNA-binding NarL/FixJ family response regulator